MPQVLTIMKKGKYTNITYLITGLIAICYVLIRAIKVGVTYDEVWTIEEFVSQKFINIINYTPCDANNHIINTLLIKLFFLFGNHSLFIARLPNVLSFILYLWFGYKITSKYLPHYTDFACFLLLLLNPFLLDFFSLARGYGLSLAFLLASLYRTLNYANDNKTTNVWKAISYGALGVLCNFSLLNYWVSLVVVLNALALFTKKTTPHFKTTFLYSLGITILLAAIIYEPIRKLKKNGNLYYGGNNNFYSDTLISLTKYGFYSPETSPLVYFSLNIFLLILFTSIVFSFFYKSNLKSSKNAILFIIILCISSIFTQHYVLGTLYLIDRTALFFYPLFVLILCFSLNSFSLIFKNLIVALITILFAVNFFIKANFYKTATWYFDAHTTELLNLINEKGSQQNTKLKIDFSWPFQSSIGYYMKKNKYPFVEIVKNQQDREDLNTNAEYYIYLTQSLEKVGYDANNQKVITFQKDTTIQYIPEKIIVFENIRK